MKRTDDCYNFLRSFNPDVAPGCNDQRFLPMSNE
jgi:hypothetical protein